MCLCAMPVRGRRALPPDEPSDDVTEDREAITSRGAAARPETAPDPIARDFLLLALRLGRLFPGIVDSYFGPAELAAQVEAEPLRNATKLREEASALDSRVAAQVREPDRARWLRAQLVAFEAQTMMLAGDPLPFPDYVACLFDLTPGRLPEAVFEAAADDLARLLPPGESRTATVADRLADWDARFVIDPARLPDALEWVVAEIRGQADRLLGLPTGEQIEFEYVSGVPWAAFSQYLGAARSRVQVNPEVLCRPAELIHLAAHECYPGYHTKHAWRERRIGGDLNRHEADVIVLGTPESLIGGGLAYLGERMVVPDEVLPDLLLDLYERCGIAIAHDHAEASAAAEKQIRIQRALASLRGVAANAAFMLHADGAPHDVVADYLERYLLMTPERAQARLAVLEDPIMRAQYIAAAEGERLLRRWFELGQVTDQVGRFGRLLREQMTPGSMATELPAVLYEQAGW
jgi:hypothetical protein